MGRAPPKKWYTKRQRDLFCELAEIGCSQKDIALEVADLEKDPDNKAGWRQAQRLLAEDPEFQELYQICRAKYKNSIAKRINSKTHDDEVGGNTTLMIFTAKTQLRWSEPKEEAPEAEFSIIVRRKPLEDEEENPEE